MLFSAPGTFRQFSSGSSFRAISIRSLAIAVFFAAISVAAHGQTATTTTLAITSGGSAVTTVTSGTVVTLTATVAAGSTPVTVGQVNFCDASVAYCTDIHLLATAQLTSAGTATYKFRPGVGSHSYKAVFLGTPHGAMNYAGSASSVAALTVTGLPLSITTIAQTGSAGDYTLTATVGGAAGATPTGTISFLDTTSGNEVLGTGMLGGGISSLSLLNTFSAGFSSNAVAVGDFNGDGIPDLAVGNSTFATLMVFLGDGKGNFTPSATISGLDAPLTIAVGDFNGDGKADIVVGPTTLLLLGNGDGTFVSKSVPLMGNPMVGDFNRDGNLDIAFVNQHNNTIAVLLGDGTGNFTEVTTGPLTIDLDPTAGDIAEGDFNGDGVTDLAIANYASGNLSILLGNGDGTFTTASSLAAGTYPASIVVGDFNGDGDLDVAVADECGDPTCTVGSVAVFLGNGAGTFTAAATVQTENYLWSAALGDFNGDGNADLAVVNTSTSDNAVTVLLGSSSGAFTTGASAAAGTKPSAVAAADFNGDGLSDFVLTNSSSTLTFLAASQTATASASGIALPASTCTQQLVASFPGDSSFSPSISAPLGLPAGRSTPPVTVTPSSLVVTTSQSFTVAIAISCGATNPTPTGTLTLTNGTFYSGVVPLSDGGATINVPAGSLAAGSNTLNAAYSGDENYNSAVGAATVTVTTSASFALSGTGVSVATGNTSTITVTPSGGFTGSVALTAAVTSSPTGATSLPTLSFGSTSPVSITGTSAVTATLTVSTTAATTPGVYEVTVTGTSGSVTATSSIPVTVPVGAAAAAVTVTPSLTPITNEQAETVAVSVAGGNGHAAPTGTVTLASGSYSAQQALASGAANFSVPAGTLSAGANTLTATYSGDGMYASATGTTTVTVSPAVMAIPTPASVAPGASATATATLNAGSTYSGTMNLSCSLTASPSGAQSLPTCGLNPASVMLAAGGSGTATLTVKTTAESTTTSANTTVPPSGTHPWRLDGGLALAGVLVLALPFRRRRWLAMLALVWLGVAGFAVGCGGGSSSSSPVTTTTPATTAGNYVFKVTGTDSSNTTVSASASVTVTVQ